MPFVLRKNAANKPATSERSPQPCISHKLPQRTSPQDFPYLWSSNPHLSSRIWVAGVRLLAAWRGTLFASRGCTIHNGTRDHGHETQRGWLCAPCNAPPAFSVTRLHKAARIYEYTLPSRVQFVTWVQDVYEFNDQKWDSSLEYTAVASCAYLFATIFLSTHVMLSTKAQWSQDA